MGKWCPACNITVVTAHISNYHLRRLRHLRFHALKWHLANLPMCQDMMQLQACHPQKEIDCLPTKLANGSSITTGELDLREMKITGHYTRGLIAVFSSPDQSTDKGPCPAPVNSSTSSTAGSRVADVMMAAAQVLLSAVIVFVFQRQSQEQINKRRGAI